MLLLLLLSVIILTVSYRFLWQFFYWQRRNVPHVKPWPIVGNMLGNFLGTRPFGRIVQDVYDKFPNEGYFGFHHYSQPTIILRDPHLIRQVCVTQFHAFTDHPQFLPDGTDPFLDEILLLLKGKRWHSMRMVISPAFTTLKMKDAFNDTKKIAKAVVSNFESQTRLVKINAREIFQRFSNNAIIKFAFGIDPISMQDKSDLTYKIGHRTFSEDTALTFLKYFGFVAFPTLLKFFKLTFLRAEDEAALREIISESLRLRRKGALHNADMIDHLLKTQERTKAKSLKGSQRRDLTDEDMIFQLIAIFCASFDSSSNVMSLLAYELALNQDVQDKLAKEIEATLRECDNELSYQAILNMEYLDMVISEILRLWPVTTFTDRICVAPCTLHTEKKNEKPFHVDAGTFVWFPIYALHRDPKYFPNPTKFDPERFSAENKEKINPYAYIPFGAGPRMCIAARLAVLHIKIVIFYMVLRFRIVTVKETEIPLSLSKKNINLVSETGPVLGLQSRTDL